MNYKESNERIAVLEKEKKYDIDPNMGEYRFVSAQEPDHRYVYDRFIDKVYYCFLRALVFIFAPFIMFFAYRLKIRGRKNLKLKNKSGAITVSNHISFLDSLIIKQVVFKRVYFVGASHNNKKGFFGYTIKILGFLPLSAQFSNQKNLNRAVTHFLKKGKKVHIDPEQAMWWGYKKLRPFKNGAFNYAVTNNVPVIPIVNLIRDANRWDKFVGRPFKVTSKVLKPVYPNDELSPKERIIDLKNRVREEMREEMNAFYGFECDVERIAE